MRSQGCLDKELCYPPTEQVVTVDLPPAAAPPAGAVSDPLGGLPGALSPGADLLDWLNRFTFREEARYAERAHAEEAAELFLDTLIDHGTTCAAGYSSVHTEAADALFSAAHGRGMALVAGKTMMDRNAPEEVCEAVEPCVQACKDLIDRWHDAARLRYAITPRFAITSTDEQLAACGALVSAYPEVLLQTHLAESPGEMEMVRQLFPWAHDYTEVYDRFGLLGPRSLFAHGIHLSERTRIPMATGIGSSSMSL